MRSSWNENAIKDVIKHTKANTLRCNLGGQSLKRKARIRFEHAVGERDYIEWKNRALAPYANPST